MSAASLRRRGLLVSAGSLALWAVSVLYLAYYVVAVGVTAEQEAALEAFLQAPTAASTEPLVVLFATTLVLGVVALCSLLYYAYAEWRYARRRRLSLERLAN